MDIPIIIISYNNWKYVKHTIEQLLRINTAHAQQIQIMDNASTDPSTIAFLDTLTYKVYRNTTNNGPWICQWVNESIFQQLPNKFILTDPDLEFNPGLPSDFVAQMATLSDELNAYKLGFALDINDFNKMFQCVYADNITIQEHESQFWRSRIHHPTYEIYRAEIDTTFALINKLSDRSENQFRMGGQFTAKHLPWYLDDTIHTMMERYNIYQDAPHSTMSKVLHRYLERN
jgi:hypothetical protein